MAIARGGALRVTAGAVASALVVASVLLTESGTSAVFGLFGLGTLLLVTRWPYVGRAATGRAGVALDLGIVTAVMIALVSGFLVFAWPAAGLKVLAGIAVVVSLTNAWRDLRVRRET